MLNLFLFRTIEIIIIGFKQKKFILSLINLITMSKFGELLDEKKPLLLVFFSEFDELSTSLHPILKDVAAAVGDKGKVIKINTCRLPRKKKRVGKYIGWKPQYKKAIVTLSDGDVINLFTETTRQYMFIDSFSRPASRRQIMRY